jgi:CO/xanthine dehydrogenase Mo-binding subunit
MTHTPRFDAPAKIAGRERYAADLYPEGLLWAGVKRSGVPHGRILGLDTAPALALPGVLGVYTHADVPGANRQGIVHKDMPVLAEDVVRHAGEPVALVLAEDKAALAAALAALEPRIEPLPGVFDPLKALAPDAPLVHAGRAQGNLLASALLEQGDVDTALDRCHAVVRAEFHWPMQAHAFLETENGVAWLEPDGQLTLVVSTQAPFRDRQEISLALGLPMERIRLQAPQLGGAFGGKDGVTVQCLLALAALKAGGRPVKMHWSMEEHFLAGYKRHAARLHYRLGALRDGSLHALDAVIHYDTGAYAHLGGEIMALGLEHATGPYRIPHVRIQGHCVYTNNPVAGAMRAFGVPQVAAAVEQLVDMLAHTLGQDPLLLRRQNALRPGDTAVSGVRVENSAGLLQCLDAVAAHPLWQEGQTWASAAPQGKKRGLGLAAVFHAMGYGRNVPDCATAKIALLESGALRIWSGVPDMGQGNAAAYVHLAASTLDQPQELFELVQPDTRHCHYSGSSAASRTTSTFGNALLLAAAELRRRLLHRAGIFLFVNDPDELELRPGVVAHPPTARELPLSRLAALMHPEERTCLADFRAPSPKEPPATGKEVAFGYPHPHFAHAVHLARVEVDELTGTVRVLDYLTATEAGKILDRQRFEQQVQGGVAQGLGHALFEHCRAERGRLIARDLDTYLLPTSLDLPQMTCLLVETAAEHTPLGLKGVGEIGCCGPLPAVANALAQALGVRILTAPLTGERVLRARDTAESLETDQ